MSKILGVALIVLGLAIAVVPHFTDCYSQGSLLTLANGATQPMKCHWTAQAEIVAGIPLAGVGTVLVFSRRKAATRSFSLMGIVLGALTLALPFNLIGTCAMATHICNTTMKPALTVFGSLAIIGSAGNFLLVRKEDSQ